jgi:peptidoglycan/xylan/chitin deacetylase (PgdA/CDA1 family)
MKCYSLKVSLITIFLFLSAGPRAFSQILKKPIPNHLVVLTFDDAVSSDYHFIAPILKKYGFGATFFVTEFPDFKNKKYYMSWNQIKKLSEMGFEIGNHTAHHRHLPSMDSSEFIKSLGFIEEKCKKDGILKPVSFAYPDYKATSYGFKVLQKKGYLFARAGGSRPYNPKKDYPYLIPSYSTAGKDSAKVFHAIKQAKDGKIVVLTIHGVPDYAHPWVTTPPALFKSYMHYLYDHNYKVISMKDLKNYINVKKALQIIPPRLNDGIQNIHHK